MHTDHSKKEEGFIAMVISQGLFLVGRLVGGNKLIEPRVFSIIENGAKIQMSPLPGTPPFVIIGNDGIRYPVPDNAGNKNLLDLYGRVTHPQDTPFLVVPDLKTPDIEGKLN
jgi:hypothetical protein